MRAVADNLDSDSEGVRRLWGYLVLNLFKMRYGIDLKDLSQPELNALYDASDRVPMVNLPDHMVMHASQALGWGGLAATCLAPSLINRAYVVFNVALIIIGLLYQWQGIRLLCNGYAVGVLRVRALLKELRKGKIGGPAGKPDAEQPGNG